MAEWRKVYFRGGFHDGEGGKKIPVPPAEYTVDSIEAASACSRFPDQYAMTPWPENLGKAEAAVDAKDKKANDGKKES